MNLLKTIKPELFRRAVSFACSNEPVVKPCMTEHDIISYQQKVTGLVSIDTLFFCL